MIDLSEEKIDRPQLKTLLRTAWKTDLRSSGNPMAHNKVRSSNFPPLLSVMIMKTLIGMGLAAFAFFIKDPFLACFYVISTMMVFLALTVLLEFSNLILSPDDYQIIAVRPVGSKTFFAAKMIHLLVYVNTLGFLLYFPSSISTALANKNPLLFPAFFAAGMLSTTAIGLFFVLLYTLMLRIVNREVMQQVLGYANLFLMFLVYMGYFVVPRLLGKESLAHFREFKPDWIYLAPTAWFAAIAKLPINAVSFMDLIVVILACTALFTLYRACIGKLSLRYAQTLSNTVGQQEQQQKRRKRGLVSRLLLAISNSEDRAVWCLIRKQFKYDNRFKMSILGILPITAIYLFMGISKGDSIPNPFRVSMENGGGEVNFLLYMAVALLPFMITVGTVNSDSYRSAWVFYASPADRTRIILSSARFALIWFCFPFTILLAGIFTWFFGSLIHAVLHCILIFSFLMILTKIMVLFYPRIPFSQPQKTGQRSFSIFIMMFVSMPTVLIPMTIVSVVGYGGYIGYTILLGITLTVNIILHRILKKTIPRRAAKMEFTAPV
jgi:ABC-2 type transport system permease protein